MQIKYDIAIADATAATTEVFTQTRPDGHVFHYDVECPYFFDAQAEVATKEEAQAFAAQFPKFVGLRGTTLRHCDGRPETGFIRVQIKLSADGVNGGVNETGLRRIRSLVRTCEKLGVELVQGHSYGNSSPRSIADYGWLD